MSLPPIRPEPREARDRVVGPACRISTMSASAARAAAESRGLAVDPEGVAARVRLAGRAAAAEAAAAAAAAIAAALRAFSANRATLAFSLRAATASGAARAAARVVLRAAAFAAFTSAVKRARGART